VPRKKEPNNGGETKSGLKRGIPLREEVARKTPRIRGKKSGPWANKTFRDPGFPHKRLGIQAPIYEPLLAKVPSKSKNRIPISWNRKFQLKCQEISLKLKLFGVAFKVLILKYLLPL